MWLKITVLQQDGMFIREAIKKATHSFDPEGSNCPRKKPRLALQKACVMWERADLDTTGSVRDSVSTARRLQINLHYPVFPVNMIIKSHLEHLRAVDRVTIMEAVVSCWLDQKSDKYFDRTLFAYLFRTSCAPVKLC
jgi:hypothetical protein